MEKEKLFEQVFNLEHLRELYQSGKIQGLTSEERELLEFCHNTDMPKFLKENVGEKPIVIDNEGGIDYSRTKYQPQNNNYYQQQINKQQIQEQKFYYLYDDEGNMIAAIPKR